MEPLAYVEVVDRHLDVLSRHPVHRWPLKIGRGYDADVIVYGHTHRQLVARVGSQLIVNPGAAGARRFNLQPSVAVLTIVDGRADVMLVPLAAD